MKKTYLEPECALYAIQMNISCGSSDPSQNPPGPGQDLAPRRL